jgi:hypothetical protein
MENHNSNKAFLHTREAAAWVPLAQSVITAVIFGLVLTVGLSLVLDAANVRRWWLWSLGCGSMTALLTMCAMWWMLVRHWFRLTNLERLTGIDFNRDGVIGEEVASPAARNDMEEAEMKVTLNRISEAGHFSGNYFNLPCRPSQLRELAEGLLDGRPFTEREWTGAGKPFSSAAFRGLRSELLKQGLIELASEKDARQGYVLTDDGAGFMGEVVGGGD